MSAQSITELTALLRAAIDPALPSIIYQAMTEAVGRIESAHKGCANAQAAEAIAAQFPDLFHHAFLGGGSDVWISARITDSKQLVALRRALADRGYKLLDVHDYPSDHRKTFNHNGIILDANFTTDENARCKYVQKGTKEVPVYELVCDEA